MQNKNDGREKEQDLMLYGWTQEWNGPTNGKSPSRTLTMKANSITRWHNDKKKTEWYDHCNNWFSSVFFCSLFHAVVHASLHLCLLVMDSLLLAHIISLFCHSISCKQTLAITAISHSFNATYLWSIFKCTIKYIHIKGDPNLARTK